MTAANPKDRYGIAKPGLSTIPPAPMFMLGQVMNLGRRKYGLMNWRSTEVLASVYYDAALRHLMAWYDGQDDDPESGMSHLAHVMACMTVLLDAELHKRLKDDRPACRGITADLISALTKPVEEKTEEQK